MPIKKCSFEILPAARPLSITGRARKNKTNNFLWSCSKQSIVISISTSWGSHLIVFCYQIFWWGGGKSKSEAKYQKKNCSKQKCQCLKYLNYVHAALDAHSRLFRWPLNLWTGHIIAASYPPGSYQTWFRALRWKKANVSARAHSSRSSLYKLVFLVANFQITPSTWIDV